MLPAIDFDAHLLDALNDPQATFACPRPSRNQLAAARSALISNLHIARVDALNSAMRVDNELAEDKNLAMLERLYDLEQRYGINDE